MRLIVQADQPRTRGSAQCRRERHHERRHRLRRRRRPAPARLPRPPVPFTTNEARIRWPSRRRSRRPMWHANGSSRLSTDYLYGDDSEVGWSQAFSCRRSIAVRAGLFAEALPVPGGEDGEFVQRLSACTSSRVIDKTIVVHHVSPSTVGGVLAAVAGARHRGAFRAPAGCIGSTWPLLIGGTARGRRLVCAACGYRPADDPACGAADAAQRARMVGPAVVSRLEHPAARRATDRRVEGHVPAVQSRLSDAR